MSTESATPSTDYGDLIARLAKDSGPNRESDEQICNAVYGKQLWWEPSPEWCRLCHHKPTASIDAALTLLPEGWDFSISGPHYNAKTDSRTEFVGLVREYPGGLGRQDTEGVGRHISPALALLIAILRAREEMEKVSP